MLYIFLSITNLAFVIEFRPWERNDSQDKSVPMTEIDNSYYVYRKNMKF